MEMVMATTFIFMGGGATTELECSTVYIGFLKNRC